MMTSRAFIVVVLLGALLVARAGAAGSDDAGVARLRPLPVATSQPAAVREALHGAERAGRDILDTWIEIARTPAPPGHESERARLLVKLLTEAGAATRLLADGNVEARLPAQAGARALPPAVLSAHLDALHEPSAEHPVRQEGPLLVGPAVLDDGSGLAAMVVATRLLARAGWKPRREVRVLATVGEEVGLVGSKSYVKDHPGLAAYVSLDGVIGAVDYGATGIRWTRFRFLGKGGHTLLSDRTPSPSFAAGRAIAAIASLTEDSDLPLNVGQVSGPGSPNEIPVEVSFTVDVRAEDSGELARMQSDIVRVCRAAAEREGVTLQIETMQDLPAIQPAGGEAAPLPAGAIAILKWLDVPVQASPRGSSDHDSALAMGVPGIAVGVTLGRHAHAPEEVADIAMMERGVRETILLLVLLGEGLPEEESGVAQ